jgi:hypothetical protein
MQNFYLIFEFYGILSNFIDSIEIFFWLNVLLAYQVVKQKLGYCV